MLDLATFDLAADAERGATIPLMNPRTGEPLIADDGAPVSITITGADGKAYRRAQTRAQQAMAAGPTQNVEERAALLDQQSTIVLAAVTTGWHGIVVDGSAWDFTREAAEALYGRFNWIKQQIDVAVADRNRFAPAGLSEAA